MLLTSPIRTRARRCDGIPLQHPRGSSSSRPKRQWLVARARGVDIHIQSRGCISNATRDGEPSCGGFSCEDGDVALVLEVEVVDGGFDTADEVACSCGSGAAGGGGCGVGIAGGDCGGGG